MWYTFSMSGDELFERVDQLLAEIQSADPDQPARRRDALQAAAQLLAELAPEQRERLRGRRIAAQVPGGHVLLDVADWTSLAMLASHAWERQLQRLCQKLIQPGEVVLDIGAHTGVYTTLFCALVGARGRVFAFEPLPANAELLNETLALNRYEGIGIVEAIALGDVAEPGTARLLAYDAAAAQSPRYLGASSMLHSLIPSDGYSPDGGIVVPVTTHDRWAGERSITDVAFVKIDTEGAELAILRGGRELLRTSPAIKVLVELHPAELAAAGATVADVVAILVELGLEVHDLEVSPDGVRVSSRRAGEAIVGQYVMAVRRRR